MSIKFTFNGNMLFECDSAEEAAALALKLKNGEPETQPGISNSIEDLRALSDYSDSDRFRGFLSELSDVQRKLVMRIASSTRTPGSELTSSLGIKDKNVLGAHFSNLKKRAKRHNLPLGKLWQKQGPKKAWELVSTRFLRSHAPK